MPPSPLSLLWPTMLMPKKLYFSVLVRNHNSVNNTYKFVKRIYKQYQFIIYIYQQFTDPCSEWRWLCSRTLWSLSHCWRRTPRVDHKIIMRFVYKHWQYFLRANHFNGSLNYSLNYWPSHTLSKRGGRCFLRLRCRLRSLDAVLCSVALLNLRVQGSIKGERSEEKHAVTNL